jgi:hypothetical protein
MIKITLCDPNNPEDKFSYTITPYDGPLKKDWLSALEKTVKDNIPIDNDFCHLGFKYTKRNLKFLCDRLNECREIINEFPWENFGLETYMITEEYKETSVVLNGHVNHFIMNRLHNHFEVLNGTIENPSPYIIAANNWPEKKEDSEILFLKNEDNLTPCAAAIKDLNLCCHEIESLICALLDNGAATTIVQWYQADRFELTPEHRELFSNEYNREFGVVYMHWSQVGKTLLEVYKDEGAPSLDNTTCEAITHLAYYSSMFDIHWGKKENWADQGFWEWLEANGIDREDRNLSLGYMPIGKVDIKESFGTEDREEILKIYSKYLHIYSIEVNNHTAVYSNVPGSKRNYSWKN